MFLKSIVDSNCLCCCVGFAQLALQFSNEKEVLAVPLDTSLSIVCLSALTLFFPRSSDFFPSFPLSSPAIYAAKQARLKVDASLLKLYIYSQ